jgi:hypothetical protein
MARYDVIAVSAALRALLQMDASERAAVIDCLVNELEDPPSNASYKFLFAGVEYTGKALSCGYVAVFRPAAETELKRVARNESRQAARRGFVVFDLLAPESAFAGPPWLRA